MALNCIVSGYPESTGSEKRYAPIIPLARCPVSKTFASWDVKKMNHALDHAQHVVRFHELDGLLSQILTSAWILSLGLICFWYVWPQPRNYVVLKLNQGQLKNHSVNDNQKRFSIKCLSKFVKIPFLDNPTCCAWYPCPINHVNMCISCFCSIDPWAIQLNKAQLDHSRYVSAIFWLCYIHVYIYIYVHNLYVCK